MVHNDHSWNHRQNKILFCISQLVKYLPSYIFYLTWGKNLQRRLGSLTNITGSKSYLQYLLCPNLYYSICRVFIPRQVRPSVSVIVSSYFYHFFIHVKILSSEVPYLFTSCFYALLYILIFLSSLMEGYAVAQLVETLHHQTECREFDSLWDFSDLILPAALGPKCRLSTKINNISCGVKAAGAECLEVLGALTFFSRKNLSKPVRELL